jgi:5-bromo-4-chloroindolyl phosphate hydrolysis protein
MVFLLSLLFAAKAFVQDPANMLRMLAAFALLLLATWLTREGIRAKGAYDERRSARRPAFPRKIFGSVLTGLGLGIAAASAGAGMALPVLIGLAGAILHFATFGPDPMTDKGREGVDTYQQDRAARIVADGEAYLKEMRAAALPLADRRLSDRIDAFAATARTLFRTVEEDPRDLTAARRYLGVYLMGARDATIKFADLWRREKDASARADYEALLTDLETNFAQRTRALLSDNRSDLDVEISVLRDRLQREGVVLDLNSTPEGRA